MASPPVRRSPIVRVIAVIACLVTAWHVFASFLWIAPPSPLREVVPNGVLAGYMLPLFGQSWSVFAPDPINGSFTLEVRAAVSTDGDTDEITDWVDATAVEYDMIRYNLFPPRAGIQAGEVASTLKRHYEALVDGQREVVNLNYFKDEWESRLAEKLGEYEADAKAETYLKTERMADAYATQVALAVWGDDVQRVQVRVTRQNVIPFADRADDEVTPPAPQVVEIGWRGIVRNPGQSDDAFRDVFLPAYERLNG